MGARSKKLWIDINGENTGRSFGGESIKLNICVGTSGSYSRKVCTISIDSYEVDKNIYYDITIDGQRYLKTSFNTKTKEFDEVKGDIVCGDPEYLEARKNKDELSTLKMVSMIASLGDIFCDNKNQKNDWKMRMLKAGIPQGALHVPEDWDTLDEDEKERRLNSAIETLKS
jgi:hypothetical protein